MIYSEKDIEQLDRISRLKLINSVTGIKPANLIGTIDEDGKSNLAIFSSVVHLGSNPALIGFISRPSTTEVGHTYRNISKNGFYTINHVHPEYIKNAHYTSAKFAADTSEFERCNFTEEYINSFKAPFVKESNFKFGLRFKEAIDITINDTVLIIGEIVLLSIPNTSMVDGDIDLEHTDAVGISGLNTYYSLKKLNKYPYARVKEVPKF